MSETEKRREPLQAVCRTCKETIKAGARKCIHCESYQDWRRFLAVGNTTLSLLVALASVLGVAVPLLWSRFSEHEENIAISLLDCDPREAVARLLLSNLGDRAGGVRAVKVATPKQEWELDIPYPDTILEPQKTREIRAHSFRYLPELDREQSTSSICHIRVALVRFSGEERNEEIPYSCIIRPETGRLYNEAAPTDRDRQ